ncbi:MAG: hypothetical protein ACOWWO_11620 [Peptococcaceae bacterium]
MKVMDDIKEWVAFCDELVYQMRDFKSSEYKKGVADGIEMAVDMLKGYLEDYPEYKDLEKN